jgi:hypothetical protein
MRFFGCGKFSWLASEAEDRLLTSKERAFMDRHRSACFSCARREEASALALNMLREARLDSQLPAPQYETRLLRRLRVQTLRMGMVDWSPALFGAAIAAVALISALQMLARSSELPIFRAGSSDARRIQVSSPEFPQIPIADRIADSP